MSGNLDVDVVVLGSGPGGYTAAFRAADLGKTVALVEYYENIGGVCLNVGCIPSKALLHAAKVIDEANHFSKNGIEFGAPKIDIDKVRAWKDSVITRLTGGLKALSKQRKVQIVHGKGSFLSDKQMQVEGSSGTTTINFRNAIIAAGSRPVNLPFLPEDDRVLDSTSALELKDVPENLLVIGGGIIGMEMGTVYHGLGSNVTIVELTGGVMPGVDHDLVKVVQKYYKKRFKDILVDTKVTKVEAKQDGMWVTFEGKNAPSEPQKFDKILSAVGRAPNGKSIGAENAGVTVDERGFIPSNTQMQTNVPHIYSIGDIKGNPMLAHKAIPEGKIAAEVICGEKHYFEPKCIPNVAYTDPEVAWVGLTEIEAKAEGIEYETGVFPWAASGRSLAMDRNEGVTKVIYEKSSHQLIGCGIVGSHAGDLIAEAALAIEMGCEAADIALTIHPHPTLSETICQATEAFEGTITDLYMPKKK